MRGGDRNTERSRSSELLSPDPQPLRGGGGGRKLSKGEGEKRSPREGKRKQAGHPQGGTREGTSRQRAKGGTREGGRSEEGERGLGNGTRRGGSGEPRGLRASHAKRAAGVLSGHSRVEGFSWPPAAPQDDEEAVQPHAAAAVPSQRHQPVRTSPVGWEGAGRRRWRGSPRWAPRWVKKRGKVWGELGVRASSA